MYLFDEGVFDGIENAKATEGGNYMRPGSHDLEVIRLTSGITRAKNNGRVPGFPFFAVDFRILGTSPADGAAPHHIGEMVNWFAGFDKEPTPGNVKAFAIALLSKPGQPVDPSTINGPLMDALVEGDGKLMAGTRLRVQVTLVDTKAGGKFSRHLWFPAGATAVAGK